MLGSFYYNRDNEKPLAKLYKPPMIDFDKLPISELHNHVEGGTLTPELVSKFAKRNGQTDVPKFFNEDDVIVNYVDKVEGLQPIDGDFLNFLKAYDGVSDFVITHEDVSDLVYDYLRRCHENGAIYVELGCSPDHLKKDRVTYEQVNEQSVTKITAQTNDIRLTETVSEAHATILEKHQGLSYKDFVVAVAEGIDNAREDFGIEARMIMILLRHNADKEGALEKDLADILEHRHPYVVGIGLAGDEFNYRPERFEHLFNNAKQAGLKVTAHAGEHNDAASMRTAIDVLQLDRVGHGVHCHDDEALIEYIKEKGIGLEICPTSNEQLKVYSIEDSPFLKLFRKGVKLSINSDDPSFFGIDLGDEWALLEKQWKLSLDERIKVAKDAIGMSFCGYALKELLLNKIDLFAAFHKLSELLGNSNHLKPYKHSVDIDALNQAMNTITNDYKGNQEVLEAAKTLKVAHNRCLEAQQAYDAELDDMLSKKDKKKGTRLGLI